MLRNSPICSRYLSKMSIIELTEICSAKMLDREDEEEHRFRIIMQTLRNRSSSQERFLRCCAVIGYPLIMQTLCCEQDRHGGPSRLMTFLRLLSQEIRDQFMDRILFCPIGSMHKINWRYVEMIPRDVKRSLPELLFPHHNRTTRANGKLQEILRLAAAQRLLFVISGDSADTTPEDWIIIESFNDLLQTSPRGHLSSLLLEFVRHHLYHIPEDEGNEPHYFVALLLTLKSVVKIDSARIVRHPGVGLFGCPQCRYRELTQILSKVDADKFGMRGDDPLLMRIRADLKDFLNGKIVDFVAKGRGNDRENREARIKHVACNRLLTAIGAVMEQPMALAQGESQVSDSSENGEDVVLLVTVCLSPSHLL